MGRSADAKQFDPEAITLAVRAHVRHALTDYDELLMTGWDRSEARAQVMPEIERVLARWSNT